MATLATINGEALAVPGLTFWGKRTAWGNDDRRIALICSDQRGAVELWTCENWMTSNPMYRKLGGVEIHARSPQHDFMTNIPDCEIVGGGCWTDGSSLAYSETFLPMIDRGDHAGVLRELANWHAAHFGPLS